MSEETTHAETAPIKYHAAVLAADGNLTTQSFDTLDELTAHLKTLVDRDVSVACFAGTRLGISKPPFRHLLTPWGPQPLFDAPTDNLEEDESGYLGLDPIHLEGPPTISTRPAATTSQDEFFSDEDENAIDIFNTTLPDPDA